jgi:hypothetical protein
MGGRRSGDLCPAPTVIGPGFCRSLLLAEEFAGAFSAALAALAAGKVARPSDYEVMR